MSFIRSKQIPPKSGNFYDYEVQTIHEDGHVRQRVVQYIGRSGTVRNPVLKGDIYIPHSSMLINGANPINYTPKLKVECKNKRIETVNSITKALHILELFSENDDGLPLGDITQLTGINESTVSHVVSTLVVNGFLSQHVNRGKYYLGVNFLNIAEALKHDHGKKSTISYLAELSRLLNGSVVLGVWHRYGIKAEFEQLGTIITKKQNRTRQIGSDLKDVSEIRNGEGYPIGVIFPVDFTIRSTFHSLDKLTLSYRVCALKLSRVLAEKSDEMIGECINDTQSTAYIPGWDLKEKINTTTAFDKKLKSMNTITKALRILKVFSENDNGLSLGDIAKSAGLARSTVSRLVSTLALNGFLVQLKKRGNYYLGVRFLDIAGTIKPKNRDSLIISYLLELSQIVDMPVHFEVMYNSREWIEENVDFYKEDSNVNERIITYLRSCTGKIVLANLKHTDLRKYFRYTYLTESLRKIKSDIGRLKADLVVIRQKQVAYESEDVVLGVNGIATGIKNNEGALIGVLSIVGDSNRLTNTKLKDIIPIVRTYKLMISKALIA